MDLVSRGPLQWVGFTKAKPVMLTVSPTMVWNSRTYRKDRDCVQFLVTLLPVWELKTFQITEVSEFFKPSLRHPEGGQVISNRTKSQPPALSDIVSDIKCVDLHLKLLQRQSKQTLKPIRNI